ncbi:hypothetical protein AYI68_g6986 [Smittium mucronatum]|uniref:Uncharacterized protein n=1 Tax=Smittium mucronatum TaxID=133383 RepID=A0A1R0GQ00_9FUNG|nr:hypothetical protein AYI68_g6986 [Smittium mucronatum]
MKGSSILRASAIKWHKHVPLIKFIGPRSQLWKAKVQQLSASPVPTVKSASGATVIQYPSFSIVHPYAPLSPIEIEAIESGGASLYD